LLDTTRQLERDGDNPEPVFHYCTDRDGFVAMSFNIDPTISIDYSGFRGWSSIA